MHALKRVYTGAMLRHFDTPNLPYQQIVALFIPLLVNQAFVNIMSMLNTAMISSSGAAAVSAVSMVDSLNIFVMNVFIAVATGGTVVVAQYRGADNKEMVSKTATQAVSAVFLLAAVLCIALIGLHQPVLSGLFGRAEEDVLRGARLYLIGSCASYPAIALVEVSCGVLRGVSETKSSLALSLITNIGYVLFNLLFVVALRWGIAGLVASMLLSRAIGMVCSLVYLVKINHSLQFKIRNAFKIDWDIQKKIMFIGIPFAAEQLFFNGGKLLTQTFIVQMGTSALTVNAIGNSLLMIMQIMANAMQLTVVTVVGQCTGRQEHDNARKYTRSFVKASTLSLLVSGIAVLLAFKPLVGLFSPDPAIIPQLFNLTLLSAVMLPIAWSSSFITPAALRAAGDSRYTSIVSLVTMWVIRVVLGYVLGIMLNMGIFGVFLAMEVEWCVRGVAFALRLKGDKWTRNKLI